MSHLERIEYEAKERQKRNHGARYPMGRGADCAAAEAAVDELIAMMKRYEDEVEEMRALLRRVAKHAPWWGRGPEPKLPEWAATMTEVNAYVWALGADDLTAISERGVSDDRKGDG